MRPFSVAVCAALLAASLGPMAAAAPAHADEGAADPRLADARKLADIMNGANHVDQQVDVLLATMAKQAFTSDPSLLALNQEYPGADRVFVDTLRPIILDELTMKLPEYTEATAAFLVANFNQAELGELIAFWTSPTGQALLDSVSASFDYDSMTREIVDQMDDPGGGFTISDQAIAADKRKAAASGVGKLTQQQRTALLRFGLTPTGRKMAKLAPQKSVIDREWANREPSPEALARIQEELPKALLAFMEAEDRKRAAAP